MWIHSPMIYLSGASNNRFKEKARELGIGLMAQPGSGYRQSVDCFEWWAADNGCFAQGDAFNADTWLQWLEGWPRERCLFAVAPDVLGDAAKTLNRSRLYLPRLRAMGFPGAFVAQDGIDEIDIPWPEFDVLFIGGTTAFKFSDDCRRAVSEARRQGKWVHVGRVNSYRRLSYCASIGVDSVDGTFLAFGPDVNLERLKRWLTKLNNGHQLALVGERSD